MIFGTILFSTAAAALVLAGAMILAAAVLRRGGPGRGRGSRVNDESRTIQELHAQLSRMEARIEALETIIMEDHGGKDPR